MHDETPDTLTTLPRTTSPTPDPDPEPNPLEEMEKEEAAKNTAGRRRGASGAATGEEDPLAASISRLVERMDSGQELLQNLVHNLSHVHQPQPQPQTGREAFVSYMTHVLNTCSLEHFKLLRRTLMQTVEQHGICDPSATPAATPGRYTGAPLPSSFPSPNTLLAGITTPNWTAFSPGDPATSFTQLATPHREAMPNLAGYVKAALGEPLVEEPAPGPSGKQ